MSRFVSAGTIEEPRERDEEWIKAQQELEANRKRKLEEEGRLQDASGKSLFEVLQANKAAKQEAFEESIRLKNQFRSLDNDEIEFLDSVMESTRAKEAAIQKETNEQLDVFRRQREEAERKARLDEQREEDDQDGAQWRTVPRKRRKVSEKDVLPGVKVRRVSSSASEKPAVTSPPKDDTIPLPTKTQKARANPPVDEDREPAKTPPTPATQRAPSAKPANKASPVLGLGLEGYSSDDD